MLLRTNTTLMSTDSTSLAFTLPATWSSCRVMMRMRTRSNFPSTSPMESLLRASRLCTRNATLLSGPTQSTSQALRRSQRVISRRDGQGSHSTWLSARIELSRRRSHTLRSCSRLKIFVGFFKGLAISNLVFWNFILKINFDNKKFLK